MRVEGSASRIKLNVSLALRPYHGRAPPRGRRPHERHTLRPVSLLALGVGHNKWLEVGASRWHSSSHLPLDL